MSRRLEVRDLSGGYPDVNVFTHVSFHAEPGEILTILGANGSGKSALLATVQGLLPGRSGTIELDGESVGDLPPEARAARGMSLVSDRRWLFREMSVAEHLRVGAYRAGVRSGWRGRAEELLVLFSGISPRRGVRPADLSGGVQQQLALARFAMSCPRVWLLDDPLQGLDGEVVGRVLEWIRKAAANGAAVVLTGQHVEKLLDLATKALFLENGTVAALPPGAEGLRDPRVQTLL